MRQADWLGLGIPYPQWALDLAAENGWDADAHLGAVLRANDDDIGSTHPYLFLPEVAGRDYDAAEADGTALYESVYGLDVDPAD